MLKRTRKSNKPGNASPRRRNGAGLPDAGETCRAEIPSEPRHHLDELSQLEASRDYYAGLYDLAPIGYLTLDESGRILEINLVGARLLGVSRERLEGEHLGAFITPDERRKYLKHLALCRRGKLNARLGTTLWLNSDAPGGATCVELISTPFDHAEKGARAFKSVLLEVTERKRAETALRESEARFRIMADAAPVLIWVAGTDKGCTYFNSRWLEFTGRRLEEELGNGWIEGVHPDDLLDCLRTYAEAFDARREFKMEYRLRHRSGEYRWLLDHGVPRASTWEDFRGYIGCCIDITDRKETEVALEMASRLPAENPSPVMRLNHGRVLHFANRAAGPVLADWGVSLGERAPPGIVDIASAVLAENKRRQVEIPAGQHVYQVMFSPMRDRSYVNLYFSDVTERRRAEDELRRAHDKLERRVRARTLKLSRANRSLKDEIAGRERTAQALRASERRLSDFFEESPFGLMLVSGKGIIRAINKAGMELLGCVRDECLDRSIREFFIEPAFHTKLLGDLTGDVRLENHRVRLRRRDGGGRHVLVDTNSVSQPGEPKSSRWFVRDITRRMELEREILVIAERERQRIGRDLHDDLCQQLAGIEFLCQSQAGSLDPVSPSSAKRAREIAEMVRNAITHTRELAQGLSPAELNSGGLSGALEELAERTRRMFGIDCVVTSRTRFQFQNQELNIHLYRIAQEAVTNALKHGRARRIEIGLARNKRKLALAVKDNGRGMVPNANPGKGMGLRIMQYRAGVIDGTLVFQQNPEGGVTVICTVGDSSPRDKLNSRL